MDYQLPYAELVIKRQLQLRQGEALSINTESSTIEFARLLARLACEVTIESVQIVETEKGRIKQVYPIDPKENEALRPKVNGVVMCHIVDLDRASYYSEKSPMEIAKDVVELGNFGLLAEPVELDRRLAVPWANIPYPGATWGLQHLEGEATEQDLWNLFASLYRLDSPNPVSFWSEQANMLSFRKKRLNAHKAETLIMKGDGWELSMKIAKDTMWSGGEQELSSSRKFCSMLPLQHLYATIDSGSAKGSLTSTRPFLLLGKLVKDATIYVSEGKAVSWQAEEGQEALDAFFSVDEGAKHLTEISLADENTRESRLLKKASHPLFNKAMTSHIGFGGFNLETLERHISEEDLISDHLSTSLVHLDIPIGSSHLSIVTKTDDGEETVVMEEGVCLDA
jgi:aminopeptidase